MPNLARSSLSVLIIATALAGCAVATRVDGDRDAGGGTARTAYVPDPGRDPASVAALRGGPPTESPDITTGTSLSADTARLLSEGYIRLGVSRHPADAAAGFRDEALRQGRAGGADRIVLYGAETAPAPAARANGTDAGAVAAYFVHVRLRFGATFRDLDAAERTAIGGAGVSIGSVVGNTPAARANLQGGDVITEVDGKAVSGKAAFQALLRAGIGRSTKLTIVRNGERLQRVVRLDAGSAAAAKP